MVPASRPPLRVAIYKYQGYPRNGISCRRALHRCAKAACKELALVSHDVPRAGLCFVRTPRWRCEGRGEYFHCQGKSWEGGHGGSLAVLQPAAGQAERCQVCAYFPEMEQAGAYETCICAGISFRLHQNSWHSFCFPCARSWCLAPLWQMLCHSVGLITRTANTLILVPAPLAWPFAGMETRHQSSVMCQ